MDPLLEIVLLIASNQVGQRETSRNRGPMVDEYLRATHLDPEVGAYPWCTAFVQWCFIQAAESLGIHSPLPRTASVLGLWQRSEPYLRPDVPSAGDIFLIDHGRGRGHCGFVELVNDENLTTIEGNTNPAGSREGDGVYRRTRELEEINLGYLRYAGFAKPKGNVA